MDKENKKFPEFGDVIMSPKFVFGEKSKDGLVRFLFDKRYENHIGEAQDFSRSEARFVVESAFLITADRENRTLVGSFQVTARRLNDDGTYNINGELLDFFMSGLYGTIFIDDVKVVGKMKSVNFFI